MKKMQLLLLISIFSSCLSSTKNSNRVMNNIINSIEHTITVNTFLTIGMNHCDEELKSRIQMAHNRNLLLGSPQGCHTIKPADQSMQIRAPKINPSNLQNKHTSKINFHDHTMHALSTNIDGTIIAGLSSHSLEVVDLSNNSKPQHFFYSFNQNDKNVLSTCSYVALNEEGNLAAVSGVDGCNASDALDLYSVYVLKVGQSNGMHKNLKYIIPIGVHKTSSLCFIGNNLFVQKEHSFSNWYDLNKGSTAIAKLTQKDKESIYKLYLINHPAELFQIYGNEAPMFRLTEADYERLNALPANILCIASLKT